MVITVNAKPITAYAGTYRPGQTKYLTSGGFGNSNAFHVQRSKLYHNESLSEYSSLMYQKKYLGGYYARSYERRHGDVELWGPLYESTHSNSYRLRKEGPFRHNVEQSRRRSSAWYLNRYAKRAKAA